LQIKEKYPQDYQPNPPVFRPFSGNRMYEVEKSPHQYLRISYFCPAMREQVCIWILILSLFAGCEKHDPVQVAPVNVEGLYSVNMPDFLKPSYDMHDFASLQYYDPVRRFHVIGIEDSKENFGILKRKKVKLGDYYRFVEASVFELADSTELIGEASYTEGDLKARFGDYYARNQFMGKTYTLFYRVAVYESPTYFFQMVIWTPFEGYCDKIEWVDLITYTFHLMDAQKEETISSGAHNGDPPAVPKTNDASGPEPSTTIR
jgi:hypothetical protein